MSQAFYAYAVLAAPAAIPDMPGLEQAGPLTLTTEGAAAALVSAVPPWLAEGRQASDADWVSRQAQRHHAVCRALAGMALPLAFGTVFASDARLRLWLAERAAPLATSLACARGCAEWTLLLREDASRLASWLTTHDAGLARLATAAAEAGPDTRFRLERRLERAREKARARHVEAATARLEAALADHARALLPARTGMGLVGVTALLPGAPPLLDDVAGELAATGLSVTLTGPWPPYAFAREALAHAQG